LRLSTISLLALVALFPRVLHSQQSAGRQPFRTGTELVQLDVVVLDGQRQPVRGLTASDFTVLDDGTPATIRAFTPVELARHRPSDAVWAAEIPPDVTTNHVANDEGRLIVILMDRSIPPGGPVVKSREIANAAIDALGPHDLAAIVSTSNNAVQSGLIQGLTADRERLRRTIAANDASTGISAEAEGLMNKDGFQMSAMNDTRCPCGVCVLQTMTRVADAMQHAQRRPKLLLFIGSNLIWQWYQPASAGATNIGCEGRVKDARVAMFAAIDRANVTVHSLDPQGMVNDSPQAHATPRTGPPRSAIDTLQAGRAPSLRERENLAILPDRTGGRTVVARNDPEATLPQILRESETYYVIGIERAASKRPNGTRSIEVKVARRGLRVVAPRQYLGLDSQPVARGDAAPAPIPLPINDALSRLLPNSSVPLALAVTMFAGADAAKPIVRVDIDAGAFAPRDGTAVPLNVSVIAVDQGGHVVASAKQSSTVSAKSAPATSPEMVEVNVRSQLQLEPGTYGLRVAVADSTTGRVASVFSDVVVADFADAPLSLSSVSVEAGSRARAPAATTRRTFTRAEQVRTVAQIYQGTQRTDAIAPVVMRVRIIDARGNAIRDESLPFAETAFTNRRADCVITLPLAQLPPGEYLLRLDASAARQTAGRAVRFSVE